MSVLARDLRYALRRLARTPGFAIVAILTLALGIGANTAIFTVVKAVLLDPLPYRDAGRIVAIQSFRTNTQRPGNISGGDYPDLVGDASPFAAATRYAGGELPVEISGRAEFAPAFGTDAGFADVFQLEPIAGRRITPDEYRTKAKVALVGEGFAVRHFGEPQRALGRVVRIEENALSIIGVLPATFHFPLKSEIWMPLLWENTSRTAGNYRAVALLRPGVTIDAARAYLASVGARLQQAFPSTHAKKTFIAIPLKDLFVERSRTTLWVLMAAVALVLLVACANIANLLLARATARSREMAVRCALGASRRRLVAQLLVESVLLSFAGGAVGLALAFAGVRALLRLSPPNLPRLDAIHVDAAALVFNLAISLVAAIVFGLWPAFRAARVDLHDALKQGGSRGVFGGGRAEWVRGALVAAEVALALVLALGAGLLFRSFLRLSTVDLGYQTEGRTVLTVSIPASTQAQHLEAGATFERIFAALRRMPGVIAAAGVMGLPGGPYSADGYFAVEGMHDFERGQMDKLPHAGFRLASPDYFAALGVPIIAGRDFNDRDLYAAEPVAIVSASLARQVFGDRSPLDAHIKCGLDRNLWMRVVGVVGDIRSENPATPPGPELYMPYRQHPFMANDLNIIIRAQGNIGNAALKTVAQIDPRIPVKVATFDQIHSDTIALPRFRTFLLIVFAGTAAILAAAGVYGVMSYVAAQRNSEMGVRMALGATASDIIVLLVGSAAKLAAIGIVCGLALAWLAGRGIESMLYAVRLQDPPTIAAAILLLVAASLLAALLPALRAARVDPAQTLREE